MRIDLARYAGATGRLTFRASTAESNPGPTSALFSAPRILVPPAADEPNLLLVTIDCLRADHVGAYGYPRPTTPTSDALASLAKSGVGATAPSAMRAAVQVFPFSVTAAPTPTTAMSISLRGMKRW